MADQGEVMKVTRLIMSQCATCQACQKPRHLRVPIEPTIIPPAIISSVALDMFDMPNARHDGQVYNYIALCVDRHSGWVVAVPCKKEKLTGAEVTKEKVKQWRCLGVPNVITTD